MGVGLSWNGRYRTASVNVDARTETTVLDTKTGKLVELPKFPSGGFSRGEQLAAFYVNGDTAPSDLYVLDLATGKHRKLTSSLNPKIKQEHLVDSSVVRYPAPDKLPIPALLYRPRGASAANKVPALCGSTAAPAGSAG